MSADELRQAIIASLESQGFTVDNGRVYPPNEPSKDMVRALHRTAVEHRLRRARRHLARHQPRLVQHLANGCEVNPHLISPTLVPVKRRSEEELLFRYCCLHWSIPVSSGYGRRLRLLVIDQSNGKLIGLIGLGDPVFSLKVRDAWVGWDADQRRKRLRHVMDAFVLGAVPPYSYLLGGKLVALLAVSDEVRTAVADKYRGSVSRIGNKPFDGHLAMLTTSSALGRSSIYNRLRYQGQLVYRSVGYTRGSGEFHFANGLYERIQEFVRRHTTPTAKHERWGKGFRNRREIIRKGLKTLSLPDTWIYHGVRREVFVMPLAANTRAFLRGEAQEPTYFQRSVSDLTEFFKERWLIPRIAWDRRYRAFRREEYLLWQERGGAL